MKKFSFGRLIENKRFTMVFSILIAVIAWLVVVIQLDPMQKKVIRDIPVTYDLADTQADKLGLEVIKIEPANVSITVEGKRYQVSKLTQADFKVEFSAVSIQGAGSYTLELRASSKENSSEFQVANISPSTVNVTFDKVSSKTITLTAQAPNIKVEDDFILENPVPTPDKLEVKGPEQYIDRLDHGIIMTDASETLTQTTTKKGTLLLYDVDGNQLDNSWFTFDRETFEVVIPVYKQATVPLTFKYKNVPANLDTSKLEYSMSVNQIDIAGSEDAVQNISEINLGYIDIRELDVGKTFQFNISVPSGFKNISNVTQVTVTFTDTNWSSKLLDVTDIRQSNIPSGYTITVQNSSIQNVKIVGDQSVIGTLMPNDLVATVDYTSQPIKEGSQTVQVTIEVVSKENVWVVGSYDCIVVAQKNP
ncbi:YbbR-like domain-containing protein [Massilioclostridium coli]|uniref:CdaR family protein n=1 Tax=Massilioclostridium coli TaxID=1870991 RepID=UPI0022E6B6F7|nr:CdaR family protein [Massilioclostridium coli]